MHAFVQGVREALEEGVKMKPVRLSWGHVVR